MAAAVAGNGPRLDKGKGRMNGMDEMDEGYSGLSMKAKLHAWRQSRSEQCKGTLHFREVKANIRTPSCIRRISPCWSIASVG